MREIGAVLAAVREITEASARGEVILSDREKRWLNRFAQEAESLPESEDAFIQEMLSAPEASKFLKEEYGL